MTRRVLADVDWERFEAEFADLDAELDTGSPLADRILAAVRARRTRRRVLTVVAGAMSAAGLVVSVLLVVLPGLAPTGPGAAGPGIAARAHIYAAALNDVLAPNAAPAMGHGAVVGGPAAPQRLPRHIWVSNRICGAGTTSRTAASCAGAHIPRSVQRRVIALLKSRVRFTAAPNRGRSGERSVVQFGGLAVRGRHAALAIRTCAPLCELWHTMRLREKAGQWQVAGPSK